MGELLGRFHPLVVHLPIGILILAYALELMGRFKKFAYVKQTIPVILLIGIVTSALAFFTGWIMPKEGAFSERIVQLHFWSAVATTLCTIGVYILGTSKSVRLKKFYFPVFTMTMILLTITGHYGGSLTHGENFLTQSISKNTIKPISTIDSLEVFADVIHPILKDKCERCHNENKSKGGLIMSSIAGLVKGGDSGPLFKAGNAKASQLIQRVHLPEDDEEHMPPSGKKQLNNEEIELLEWWLDEGAFFEGKAVQLSKTATIREILGKYVFDPSEIDIRTIAPIDPQVVEKLSANGIMITGINSESPLVSINLARNSTSTGKKINQLLKIKEHVTELDLSYSNVTDNDLKKISNLIHLQTLKLNGTNISSKGIKYLQDLAYLRSINLFGSQVDDAVFTHLSKFERIQTVYLYQSNVTKAGVKKFADEHPGVNVYFEADFSVFKDSKLNAPEILVTHEIFEDSVEVEIKKGFDTETIYYTLDGSKPDSSSIKYRSPFYVDQTSIISAYSSLDGWVDSDIKEKTVTEAGFEITDIKLSSPPNDKYPGLGPRTLIDFELGGTVFSNGKWLGYEASHLTATLDLGQIRNANHVSVSCLEDTKSYIFFPRSIEVETSIDGKRYEKQDMVHIPVSMEDHPASHKSFILNLNNVATRFIKVEMIASMKNPEWHAAPGAKNWLFVDEMMVN